MNMVTTMPPAGAGRQVGGVNVRRRFCHALTVPRGGTAHARRDSARRVLGSVPLRFPRLIARLGRHPVRFHAHELQSQPAHQVEHAIQMRLIATDETDRGSHRRGRSAPCRAPGPALESGPEPLCQASPDHNPVCGRLQVASFGDRSTVPSAPDEWLRRLSGRPFGGWDLLVPWWHVSDDGRAPPCGLGRPEAAGPSRPRRED